MKRRERESDTRRQPRQIYGHGGAADFDLHSPYSKWKIIDSYDDVGAFERGRMVHLGEWYDKADRDRPGSKDAIKDAIMVIWLDDAQCVESNDPQFKSN